MNLTFFRFVHVVMACSWRRLVCKTSPRAFHYMIHYSSVVDACTSRGATEVWTRQISNLHHLKLWRHNTFTTAFIDNFMYLNRQEGCVVKVFKAGSKNNCFISNTYVLCRDTLKTSLQYFHYVN